MKKYGRVHPAMHVWKLSLIDIDPLSIIMDLRQYLVMENSAAPNDLNNMIGNIENNGAPWPFSNQDRVLWAKEN